MLEITPENLRWAYSKLKNYYYYYNSSTYLKDKIMDFESDLQENTFDMLSKRLNNIATLNFFMLANEDIYFKAYPKKDAVKYDNDSDRVIIEDYNAFIDMPFEFYLVDVLFALSFFKKSNKERLKYSYGNKFDERLYDMDNIISNRLLFSNHRINYIAWKHTAQKAINDKENINNDRIIIKLDIKKCFYNVYFDIKEFIMNNLGFNYLNNTVTKIMVNIYRYYSAIMDNEVIASKDKEKELKKNNYVHLPVGLFSSYVILNLLLSEVDEILSKNCLSYARYVDDILVVKMKKIQNLKNILLDYFDGIQKRDSDYEIKNSKIGNLIINSNKINFVVCRKGMDYSSVSKKISEILSPSLDFDEEEETEQDNIEINSTYTTKYLRNKVFSFIENGDNNKLKSFIFNLQKNELINLYAYWDKIINFFNEYKESNETIQALIVNIKEAIETIDSIAETKNESLQDNFKVTLKNELNFSLKMCKENIFNEVTQVQIFAYITNCVNKTITETELLKFPIDIRYEQILLYLSFMKMNCIKHHRLFKVASIYFYKINNYKHIRTIQIAEYFDKNYCFKFDYIHNARLSLEEDKYCEFSSLLSDDVDKYKIKVAVASLNMDPEEIESTNFKGTFPNNYNLYDIKRMIRKAKQTGAEIILFPEFSIPFKYAIKIIMYSSIYGISVICGLTHRIISNSVENYTLIRDHRMKLSLLKKKNYLSPLEKELAAFNHLYALDEPFPYYYIIDNGKYSYATMTCYEATSIRDRSVLSNWIELLYMPVFNKDTNYFSNIISSFSRDASCFVVQSNTNVYGDSRITAPYDTLHSDIVKIKGGDNNYFVVGTIDLNLLY